MSETLKQYCNGCVDDFYNGNNDLGMRFCRTRSDLLTQHSPTIFARFLSDRMQFNEDYE
jgi:hypothetical protein